MTLYKNGHNSFSSIPIVLNTEGIDIADCRWYLPALEGGKMDYEAQAFDLMQLFYDETGFNDHQMHCCAELEGAVDELRLERAMGLCLEAVPILAARFVRDKGGYRWTSLAPESQGPAFAAAPDAAAFELERTCRIDERVGPQVRLASLGGDRPRLAFTMNHMVSDAAGFKDFLYLFCETYRSLGRDRSFRPGRLIDGDRGLRQVLARTGRAARALALLGRGGRNNRSGELTFPFEGGPGEERPFIVTRTIGRERTAEAQDLLQRAQRDGQRRGPGGLLPSSVLSLRRGRDARAGYRASRYGRHEALPP